MHKVFFFMKHKTMRKLRAKTRPTQSPFCSFVSTYTAIKNNLSFKYERKNY